MADFIDRVADHAATLLQKGGKLTTSKQARMQFAVKNALKAFGVRDQDWTPTYREVFGRLGQRGRKARKKRVQAENAVGQMPLRFPPPSAR